MTLMTLDSCLCLAPIPNNTLTCVCVFLCRVDQGRLLDYVVSWGSLTEEKVACYLRDILEALHYLHNCRVVHLDVKVGPLFDSGQTEYFCCLVVR